ncbi:hypothetical protein RWH43_00850 [Microbacterium sp. KSW2-21]|uniref:DUF317 domain-containing protein n=1 Tax=Microbacterium algihabitans TaxID=3075992 RepID=A0ABU3RQV6_9MICO|nr:hypothetical protein [Microbacterium sp. KSW2-21]MDU0325292.1 hypothetical protein [Microbacterium sp. KSW2-21]
MSNGERWTDHDDAQVVAEGLPTQSPVRAVQALLNALTSDDPEAGVVLTSLVTPENADQWGPGFADGRRWADAAEIRISTSPRYGYNAPDVAYVKLVPEDGRPWVVGVARDDDALAWVSLVWRPEISHWGPLASWRVHSIGAPIDVSEMPRTAEGVDPRTL